jgi:hypothetical protein
MPFSNQPFQRKCRAARLNRFRRSFGAPRGICFILADLETTDEVLLTDGNVPRMSPEPFRLPWMLGQSSYLSPP